MRYMKAGDVLPPDLIDKIQSYIDGEYLYIPRRASTANPGGAANGRRAQTQERNRRRSADAICGASPSVNCLSSTFSHPKAFKNHFRSQINQSAMPAAWRFFF